MNVVRSCRDGYRSWKQPKPHPLTGDMLKPGERVTWLVMGIYRRWSVFLLLQVLTLVWWTHPQWFPGGLAGWNYIWSDLAIIVEMLVGIAFLNQSMRDARVIRDSLRELTSQHEITQQMVAAQAEDLRLLRELHDAMLPDKPGAVTVQDGTLLLHKGGTL